MAQPEAHPQSPEQDSTLPWAVWLLLLGIVLALGLFMPLQTDEIAWSYSNNRALIDHFEVTTWYAQCQDAGTFAKPLPLSWYPHAIVNHILFMLVENPLWIRIVSMARFLMLLAASWWIMKPLALRLNIAPRILFFLFTALLCQDALPLLMQINRPEQPILLSIAIFLALALNAPTIAAHPKARLAAPALFIVTALLTFPDHPKAIGALPIALICGYMLFIELTKRRGLIVFLLLAVAAFAFQSAFFWLERYQCPLAPITSKIIAKYSLPWNQMLSHPVNLALVGLKSLMMSMLEDFSLYDKLRQTYNWLPLSLIPMSGTTALLSLLLAKMAYCLDLALVCFCAAFVLGTATKPGSRTMPHLLAYAALASYVGFIMLIGMGRTFYIISLQVPLLFLTALLTVSASPEILNNRRWQRVYLVLLIAAATNILLLGIRYYPYVTQPETREAVFYQRAILLSSWNYESQKKSVQEAYAACGLPPVETARHLVLDDYTYPPLMRSFEPFSFHYITNLFANEKFSLTQLRDNMKRYDSQGIILNCKSVPATLAPLLTQHGGYCCVAAKAVMTSPPAE